MKWPVACLGEVAQVVSGATPKSSVDKYWEGDIPWITPADLSKLETKEVSMTARQITEAGLASCSSRILPARSVLLSSRAPIGHVAINAVPMATNQGFKSLVPDEDLLLPDFLFWWLKSNKSYLQSLGRGATFKEISKEIVESIEIPLPPLEEQRRIAAILDKATELETLSLKQSRLVEDAEKHLFLECFGSPFPGTTPWLVTQLGELGSLERGISKHRPRNDPALMDGPYPFIQTGDVAGCRGKITTFSATYSEKGLAQSRLWPAGTLCITIAANIAKTGILDFDACFPDSVVGFQARNPAIITYVQCWMSFLQGHIEQMAPESAQKNINLEILRGLPIPSPSEDRLEKFHTAILALRSTLSRTTHRHGTILELKSSLQSASFAA